MALTLSASLILDADQLIKLEELVDLFRSSVYDYIPEKNILENNESQFSDMDVYRYLKLGIADINRGAPASKYTMFDFDDTGLLVAAAAIMSLVGQGLFQLRNEVQFSENGVTINMFSKTGGYQSWVGFLVSGYLADKQALKSALQFSVNGGFIGIGSDYSRLNGW